MISIGEEDLDDFSSWTARDEYLNSDAAISTNETWDDYSIWSQEDRYFETVIPVSSNGEDWDVDASWAQLYVPFEDRSIFTEENWDDYSEWIKRDGYLQSNIVISSGEDWDDCPSFDSGPEDKS